jgi:hypothetical protein
MANDEASTFYQSVADCTADLIKSGLTDPHGDEIAEAYFDVEITRGIKAQVTDHLPRICEILQEKHLAKAHLVNQHYYEAYRDTLPRHTEEAENCMPGGENRRSAGIRVPYAEEDAIYRVTQKRHLASGSAKVRKRLKMTFEALRCGQMTNNQAMEVVREYAGAFRAYKRIERELVSSGVMRGPMFNSEGDGAPKLKPADS